MVNPFAQFGEWFAEAQSHPAIADATAMTLATASASGVPSARMVLLKTWNEKGFVFFTHYESQKSRELAQNPHAALCFYWPALDRQIRITGGVEKVSGEESDAYFSTRVREKQIGAWASQQSTPMANEAELDQRVDSYTKKFEGQPIPRPPHWGGWRISPQRFEFWTQKHFRLHIRHTYTLTDGRWQREQLFP